MKHSTLLIALVLPCLAIAGCSTSSNPSPTSPSSNATTPTTTSTTATTQPTTDELSPLIISTLAPDPIPVTGTDNLVHVVYELQVLNASPRTATLTQLDTIATGATTGATGAPTATLNAAQIAERGLLVGTATLSPTNVIPGGRSLVVLVDDTYAQRDLVPATVSHRISATFGTKQVGEPLFTKYFPTQITQTGGVVTTSTDSPAIIGPPLTGTDWFALNACCNLSSHRGAMLPFGGRINGAERYAIDYSRIDTSANPIVNLAMKRIMTFRGDPSKNESYLAWDQPIIAVADGTVVKVVSDSPDIAPGNFPEGVAIGESTGNRIIEDIGGGVFALYAHLKQGSPTVKVGDTVTRGQVIGRLGNSGNTSEPHLHFQLERGIAPLASDNVPFEFTAFDYLGTLTRTGISTPTPAGPRTNQLPLSETVTSYPIN